jgi:hypothetical protein
VVSFLEAVPPEEQRSGKGTDFNAALVCVLVALNVSAGPARFRQLSKAFRTTYARRERF